MSAALVACCHQVCQGSKGPIMQHAQVNWIQGFWKVDRDPSRREGLNEIKLSEKKREDLGIQD